MKLKRGDVLGVRFLAKAHTSHKLSAMHSQIAWICEFQCNSPCCTLSSPTQQSTVDHTHQPDIRSESASPVNPVILSNTAKLVVDSGCFDHCCPLELATQSELNEGRFLSASSANTIKLKHYGTRVVDGWTRDVSGTEIPLKIKFNVFDVKKSPLLSTNKLPKTRVYSLAGPTANNPEIQRHHDRVDRPERVTDTGAETREQRRMCPRLKRSARRHACATPMMRDQETLRR